MLPVTTSRTLTAPPEARSTALTPRKVPPSTARDAGSIATSGFHARGPPSASNQTAAPLLPAGKATTTRGSGPGRSTTCAATGPSR